MLACQEKDFLLDISPFPYTNVTLNNQILNLFSQSERASSNEQQDEAFTFNTKSHDHKMDTTLW